MRRNMLYWMMILMMVVECTVNNQHTFQPKDSSTFHRNLFTSFPKFENSYADGSVLSGYMGKDEVYIGTAGTTVKIGCASASSTSGSWDSDGILGLSMQDLTVSEDIGVPYFYYLCQAKIISSCVFSVWLSSTGGEIQLGGYVNKSAASSVVYTPITSPCTKTSCQVAYEITVTNLRVVSSSGRSTNIFSQSSSAQTMATIVDSGVSCTLLPTAVQTSGGTVNLYNAVASIQNPQTLYVTIAGVEYAVPLSECVEKGDNSFVLGDPFFRSYLVVHDLDNKRIGLAKKNSSYVPSSAVSMVSSRSISASTTSMADIRSAAEAYIEWSQTSSSSQSTGDIYEQPNISSLPLWKRTVSGNNNLQQLTTSTNTTSFKRAIITNPVTTPDKNFYYTVLAVGTPQQTPFVVQIDTGSSLTAVFAASSPSPPAWQSALFSLAIIAAFGMVVGAGVYWYRNKYRS
eukprot:TRINITY_DN12367_c0_g1_i2.p1 TRINITY_DN12367_c0_g1~~TRINITY_DN12367_c0_g1_i2.p1  ORF type:complete len:457 (-),score=113.21 TRINITY_DN12367_c0_g1_i2:15-1385(-)